MTRMTRGSTALAGLLLMTMAAPASAQRATEQFIPLGQSPGVSGTASSYLGSLTAVDTAGQGVTMAGPRGQVTIMMNESTCIWLDRSGHRQATTVGKLSDLRVGWTVEVKYLDPAKKDVAEWIKVVMPR